MSGKDATLLSKSYDISQKTSFFGTPEKEPSWHDEFLSRTKKQPEFITSPYHIRSQSDIDSAIIAIKPLMKVFAFNADFRDLDKEIEKATNEILSLENDWDGEGAVGYKEETVKQATTFLKSEFEWAWNKYRETIDTPRIQPGPDGSIDIHWKTAVYELLINIPVLPNTLVGFYGDNYGTTKIKGQFDLENYKPGTLWSLIHPIQANKK